MSNLNKIFKDFDNIEDALQMLATKNPCAATISKAISIIQEIDKENQQLMEKLRDYENTMVGVMNYIYIEDCKEDLKDIMNKYRDNNG